MIYYLKSPLPHQEFCEMLLKQPLGDLRRASHDQAEPEGGEMEIVPEFLEITNSRDILGAEAGPDDLTNFFGYLINMHSE